MANMADVIAVVIIFVNSFDQISKLISRNQLGQLSIYELLLGFKRFRMSLCLEKEFVPRSVYK